MDMDKSRQCVHLIWQIKTSLPNCQIKSSSNLLRVHYIHTLSMVIIVEIDQENYGFWIFCTFNKHLKIGLNQKYQLECIYTAVVLL